MALTKIPGELFSVGDLDISDVGTISLDAIQGDADSNTSITFSGSDVITIATGGSNRLTIGDGALSPVTDNQIDLGTSSLEFKDAFFDGTVTSDAFVGPLTGNVTGNASGTAATVTGAAQSNITSLGTLTTLTVDNVIVNGTTIGHTDDTDLITLADGNVTIAGELDLTTLDVSGNADIDGTLEADAITVDGTALNEYIADTIGAMVGSNTETGITVTYEDGDNTLDFVIGTLNQDTTGNAATFTASANNSTDETVYPIFVDGATGSQGAETDTGFTYNPSSGLLTIAGELDAGSLDISGNADIDGTLKTDNLTVGGAQGSDGQVLTSTGSGVAWEDAASGGATSVGGLDEGHAVSGSGNFAGSILISHDGTTGTLNNAYYNTGYGYEVFDKITSGDSNTAIGNQAAYDLTSSSNNTLVGRLAGANVSTGGNHTLIGYQAGDAITDSVHNTAVGYEAQGASNGNYNTAIGDRALHATNGGDDNVAIGSRAHYGTANSATRNTVVGVSAMEGATTGSYNSAFGMRALYLNAAGTENVAAGYLCMDANTTGSYNVAYGVNALGGNQSGHNNVAIGTGALVAATSAGDNTAIGHSALASTNNTRNLGIGYRALTAQSGSSDNIAIGHDALVRQTTGANGNIAIGSYAGRATVDSASTSQLIAIGQSVASSNTGALAGYQNTFIGCNIANTANLTSAFMNTALGGTCLTNLSTGDDNVAVGQGSAPDLTSASGNICIGKDAGDALTTGGNNIYIGKSTVADGGSHDTCVVIGYNITSKGNATGFISAGGGGNYAGNNSSSWSTTSDRRIKKNIEDNTTGLDAINGIRVRNFEYRTKDEITDFDNPNSAVVEREGLQLGVIAQEIEEILPDVVTTLDSGVKSVDPDNITWYLVNAVKELSEEIKQLKEKLNGSN